MKRCLLALIALIFATISHAGEPFAVVELFTSEGCSSCPPADKFLSELVADAQKTGKRVFPLAFHVDYWNRLGWTDPFSSAQFSDRQRAYAGKFGIRSAYTPQMIVNGSEEFVGSDRERAKRAIDAVLRRPATVEVKLRWHDGTVEYEVTGAPSGSVLNLAIVERDLVTNVKSGENSGRTLRHDNVVRVFVSKPTGKGAATLPATPNASVIGYVQDAGKLTVLGAAHATRD